MTETNWTGLLTIIQTLLILFTSGMQKLDSNRMELTELSPVDTAGLEKLRLPGQLCMGSERTALIGKAVDDLIGSPSTPREMSSPPENNRIWQFSL